MDKPPDYSGVFARDRMEWEILQLLLLSCDTKPRWPIEEIVRATPTRSSPSTHWMPSTTSAWSGAAGATSLSPAPRCASSGSSPGRNSLGRVVPVHRLTSQGTQTYRGRSMNPSGLGTTCTRAEAQTQGAVTPHARDAAYPGPRLR